MEQGQRRGSLTRHRIVYPGAVYHLMSRAPGREKLFLEDGDYLRMLSIIKAASKKFNWMIFCFCLMTNHIHMLIKIKENNLSQCAKNILEKYAKYFNSKYKRKGPVFCKPFRTSLCQDDNYLLAASFYIHLNPKKAGLIDNPEKYRWSSLSLYTKEENPKTFVDYNFILSMLSNDIGSAKRIYREILKKTKRLKYKFISQDINALNTFRLSFFRFTRMFIGKKNVKDKTLLMWNKIEEYGKIKDRRGPKASRAKVYLIEQLLANGYVMSEIATLLDMKRQSIYRILQTYSSETK